MFFFQNSDLNLYVIAFPVPNCVPGFVRVAGVGEEGGSLLSYGLSYLQSVLTVDLSVRSPLELEDMMSLSELSQSDRLIMARHSLQRDNLGRAVQYMTLLKGRPAGWCLTGCLRQG